MNPAVAPAAFFEEERAWQWIKHTVFGEYIWPWARIVGKWNSQIYIVDAFAGRGSFSNPETGERTDGSPLIAAQQAIGYNKANRSSNGHRCDIICIEKHADNFAQLEDLMLPSFKSCATVLKGSYEQHAQAVLAIVGKAPVLLLLDPMGPKQIPQAAIKPFLDRAGKNDVFLTLNFSVVHRVRGMLLSDGDVDKSKHGAVKQVANLDDFFGTEDWREIELAAAGKADLTSTEKQLAQLFLDTAGSENFRFRNAYPVREKLHSSPKYWLAHLADSDKALWLCNDGVVKVDRLLLDRTYEDPAALPGFGSLVTASRDQQVEANLRKAIVRDLVSYGGTASFSAMRLGLSGEFFGRVKVGAYSRAVKALVKEGKVSRTKPGARSALADDEQITLLD